MVPLSGCECRRSTDMPGVGQQELWRGGMESARSRIDALYRVLGPIETLTDLQESSQPARDLLENQDIAEAIISRIASPHSGKGSDELCQWLYESYQTGDPGLQAVVLRYIPTLCGVYFPRTCGDIDEPLAGFEAVLLALYTEEAKARGGRPILVHLPTLSQPSLYHTPRLGPHTSVRQPVVQHVEQLSAPLEPQTAVKSTKRAAVVGLALDLFWRRISVMPLKAKLEFCQYTKRWAVLGCSWSPHVDEIARLALLSVQPVAPKPKFGSAPEVGHALASGEPLAVSEAVFEQPPHQRNVESTKTALIERTTYDPGFASPAGSVSFNSATSSVEHLGDEIEESGVKLPLPLDLLRPIFKILGHCLMAKTSTANVKEAAAAAAHALYVRASEELIPEAIMASRSLVRLSAAAAIESQIAVASNSFTSPRHGLANYQNQEVPAQT